MEGSDAIWPVTFGALSTARATLNHLCKSFDALYIELLRENHPDTTAFRTVLTHLKDARAAIQKAEKAIP